ncbi:MAG: LuxR C-terminal-related transcriptional regulator [Evtepia gabavorous]
MPHRPGAASWRTLSNHIDLACYHCTQRQAQAAQPARTLEELTQVYGLTRRETEILGLVFQDRNNEEILEQLHISKNTLLKHLQNLYRKCGVSSRWDLLKLR